MKILKRIVRWLDENNKDTFYFYKNGSQKVYKDCIVVSTIKGSVGYYIYRKVENKYYEFYAYYSQENILSIQEVK